MYREMCSYTVTVASRASSTLTFIVSGSPRSQSDALAAYDYLAKHHAALLAQKLAHYASIINRARIKIPDQRLQDVYNWTRINMLRSQSNKVNANGRIAHEIAADAAVANPGNTQETAQSPKH